ncbi:rhamnulokinase [Paracidobacterium acidisoli]|uniref:Carbohydrate kinase n=1 Tax=Paracidobacterium acidisoli TaxID=2303751 RepID=A0A372IJW9_9BACT|nr:FGGY family carbohydrate kinase [Paracidobacterium acidisoli]MBT9332583.1 carbohydrate kinase [Paracidobacterium acidisoli]
MPRAAQIAIDLGAESCRVSLLRWPEDRPALQMVHRFANGPWQHDGIRWNLASICEELETGLRRCAELAPEGVSSIGVTGWAVDYVRLDAAGRPVDQPYCYRDPRNTAALEAVHAIVPPELLYAKTGVQVQAINTVYQLYADKADARRARAQWVNLPEYILHWLGAGRVAEYTNATHTALIDAETRQWSDELFAALGLDREAAPELVAPGSVVGRVRGELSRLPAFADTLLIAPACHDTASAIAGIPQESDDWVYISSGTWSLVGTLLPQTLRTAETFERAFTNLGAAGGDVLFHRGIAGMWLLRQCMNAWEQDRGGDKAWGLTELVAAARELPAPDRLLDLDDPAFFQPGDMPARINEQRAGLGLPQLPTGCHAAPYFASLVFYSLARRYRSLIEDLERLTGRSFGQICVVGGGGRNEFLNALTAEATGLAVARCSVESSTIGNLAVQCARLEQSTDGVTRSDIARWAKMLTEGET